MVNDKCVTTSEAIGQISQPVFVQEGLSQSDVFGLSGFLGLSLLSVPGFPLGLSLEVKHAWLRGGVVSVSSLLEKAVDLKKLIIRHFDVVAGGLLDGSSSVVELAHQDMNELQVSSSVIKSHFQFYSQTDQNSRTRNKKRSLFSFSSRQCNPMVKNNSDYFYTEMWNNVLDVMIGKQPESQWLIITNIIVFIIICYMQGSIGRVAAEYSRFVLQEERKHKLLRPLLPKIAYMNLGNGIMPIEDKMSKAKSAINLEPFSYNSILMGVFNSPRNSSLPEELNHSKPQINVIQYAANATIEDKVCVESLKSIKAEVLNVFDGHGGAMLSDYCASHIVELLDDFISKNLSRTQFDGKIDLLITEALKFAYDEIEVSFFENVFQEQMRLKNKKIRSVGTCGVTVIIYGSKMYVANCGDSMALVVTQNEENVGYVTLHERLSVNNPKERERLYNEFPEDNDILIEENKGCFYLKGRLQPTRTLGDYHMKHKQLWKGKSVFNGPYVKSEPQITIHEVKQNYKFLVLASDGVWDFIDEWEVAEACLSEEKEERILSKTLGKIAEINGKTVNQIKEIPAESKRDFHDDISIIVADLHQFSP